MQTPCAVLRTHHDVPCIEGDHFLKPNSNNVGLMAGHVKPGPQVKISRGPAPIHIVRSDLESRHKNLGIVIVVIAICYYVVYYIYYIVAI